MHIVQVTPELAPIVKVGGLGDVVYGLSKELIRQKHKVSCLLPKYACLDVACLQNLKLVNTFELRTSSNALFSATCEGIDLLLIETPLLKTNEVYGGIDEVARFLYFCEAARAVLQTLSCDLVHLHDWPTSALTALITTPTLLTIHNLRYQGKSSWELGTKASLPTSFCDTDGDLNLLKGGIEKATCVTTVSPTYAREITLQEGSCELLEPILANKEKIHGILNGIDESFWDPASDPFLPFHYTTSRNAPLKQIKEGKEKNKRALLSQLGISYDPKKPLVSAIARLVLQKSPGLIKHALIRTVEKGGQFLLLGFAPDPLLQKEFSLLQKELEKGDSARILMIHDEPLAHQIYAASDLFLIPSLFEPCGLTQMISLKYGTIPIARKTGGLADTVFDIDTAEIPPEKRNGFTFDFPDQEGVNWALDRALSYYFHEQEKFSQLMLQGTKYDFSWKKSTQDYLDLYRKTISR